jgi:hypothetical protein
MATTSPVPPAWSQAVSARSNAATSRAAKTVDNSPMHGLR